MVNLSSSKTFCCRPADNLLKLFYPRHIESSIISPHSNLQGDRKRRKLWDWERNSP